MVFGTSKKWVSTEEINTDCGRIRDPGEIKKVIASNFVDDSKRGGEWIYLWNTDMIRLVSTTQHKVFFRDRSL